MQDLGAIGFMRVLLNLSEHETINLFYQILIPSISSITSVFVIGWKIKDALCKQISDLRIEIGTHIGITEPQKKELFDKIEKLDSRLNTVIISNNLKI